MPKKTRKKHFFVLLLIASLVFFAPPLTQAQNQTLISQIQEQINRLEKQLLDLLAQLEQARHLVFEIVDIPFFTKTLYRGLFDKEVEKLQILLKNWPEIYPEGLITGYFGPLTEAAVIRFQKKHNIEAIGLVGPKTRTKLNELAAVIYQEEKAQPPEKPTSLDSLENNIQKIAADIHQAINFQRTNAGLSPLNWNDSLAEVARRHSEDQAEDNLILTQPDYLCHYPLIRHEGKVFGLSLGDRLQNYFSNYRSAGENIAIIPQIKTITYEYRPNDPTIADCPTVESPVAAGDTPEEKIQLYQEALNQRLAIIINLKPVKIIGKEWRANKEIVEISLEGWMNSIGHRQNILNPRFNLGGVGIAKVNDYFIITHVFLSQ